MVKYRMYAIIAAALIVLLTGCAATETAVEKQATAPEAAPVSAKTVTGITTVEDA